jgi:hypothetical protein
MAIYAATFWGTLWKLRPPVDDSLHHRLGVPERPGFGYP